MSGLAPVLRRLTKTASHPNSLLYAMQLERARVKYLVKGELGDGKEDAMVLEAPKENIEELKSGEREGKAESGVEGEAQRGEDERGRVENGAKDG